MSSIIKILSKKQLIKPPSYVIDQVQYEVIMGSVAYGVSNDTSDVDLYAFCMPNKEIIFPHLAGEILGFGRQKKRFDQFQQHHVIDEQSRKEYDITCYNIVRYFDLCMNNNPNMLDSLFVPRRCCLFMTRIGELVRENRKLFLHKGSYHKYRGYCFSQLHKSKNRNPIGKRRELVEKIGYDSKHLMHAARLLLEIEQIMIEQDLDLERNSEILKSIRKGEWTFEQLDDWIKQKEKDLEGLYIKSELPHSPDEDKIKNLLLKCLEEHFGSLDKVIVIEGQFERLMSDIKKVISRHGG
jgi:predicted nucleotidyltransferase